MSLDAEIRRVLAEWPGVTSAAVVTPLPGGLINQSFSVSDGAVEHVLQRVNPIFRPEIHENIRAVTEHLAAKGLTTPQLVPTAEGAAYASPEAGSVWRLMTRVPGRSFDTCPSPEHARSAGALVAAFHGALADLAHDFEPLGFPFHDTCAHLADLQRAVEREREHRLHSHVFEMAEEIHNEARAVELDGDLPARAIHGDLKFNNVVFADDRATSLIDLDTLSRLPLCIDLGDAWRSWCNRAGEDQLEAELDLELFRASAEGYLDATTLDLGAAELESLALGLDLISLELAARFATDALEESYFGWDAERYPAAGEHNLARARGQLSLYGQARATRSQRRAILGC